MEERQQKLRANRSTVLQRNSSLLQAFFLLLIYFRVGSADSEGSGPDDTGPVGTDLVGDTGPTGSGLCDLDSVDTDPTGPTDSGLADIGSADTGPAGSGPGSSHYQSWLTLVRPALAQFTLALWTLVQLKLARLKSVRLTLVWLTLVRLILTLLILIQLTLARLTLGWHWSC